MASTALIITPPHLEITSSPSHGAVNTSHAGEMQSYLYTGQIEQEASYLKEKFTPKI